jgi:hypothetical protein
LTPLLLGQFVTALYVSPDGTIYYGVSPGEFYMDKPAEPVFQLWKLPPGGSPFAISPATMRMIGGILVRNGTIYFNELGTLRRMPENSQPSEGQVLLRYPAYLGNKGLPYGHMNNSLAQYNLNGQDVLLMGMGSVRDSSFPGQGLPADVAPPYYEEFPTGRITYATFDWLDQQNEYNAVRGVAGQYDELARGIRNPWGMTVGQIGGQTHIYAVDNDPSFTPEKYDANPANAGDELNDIFQATDYGHPFSYGGGQPVVNFPDTSVPSGVAIAAGKIFVGLAFRNEVVKVDPVKHTYTPVLEGISPYNLFAVGNLLYVADFNGIYVIDASGL